MSDLWGVSRVNIDEWTETFSTSFYTYYSINWKELNWTARNNDGGVIGYIIGSAGPNRVDDMMTHITAVSVCSDNRHLGLATSLLKMLECISNTFYKAKCVGLYVRPTNGPAHELYRKLGYKQYRKIIKYYNHVDEDGIDLRHSLELDPDKVYEREMTDPVMVDDLSDE